MKNKRMEWRPGRAILICVLAAVGLVLAAKAGGQGPASEALGPSEIVALAEHLRKVSKASKPARQALASRIEAQYLTDNATILTVSPKQWGVLADCLGKDMSDQRRGRWADKLRAAFGGRGMKAGELAALARALHVLGDGKASDFIASIMAKTEGWKPTRPSEVGILGRELRGDSDVVKAARRKLAMVLVRLAGAGLVYDKPTTDHRTMAVAIGAKNVRKLLVSELIDEKGRPRIALAGVLGWMHHKADKAGAWNDLIADKIAAAKDGDVKAMWLIVSAYSASIRGDVIQPRHGRPSLESAMAVAKSQDVRLLVVRHFLRGYYQSNQRLAAIEFLRSAKVHFSGDALKQVNLLQQRVWAELAAYLENESDNMGQRAQYLEAKAREAMLRKDTRAGNYFLSRAQLYRQQQRRLLSRRSQLETPELN